MQRKSYEELKIDQFIARLVEEGYEKCFVAFKDEIGQPKGLIFQDKRLYLSEGKTKKVFRPHPVILYHILSKLNRGKYKIIGYGQYGYPLSEKISFDVKGADASEHSNRG